MTTDTTVTIADVLASTGHHDTLDVWLKGNGIDQALKAMNLSAAAKKPGRVSKRVGKALGEMFTAPRVLAWEKDKKNVYASATSRGEVSEIVHAGDYTLPEGQAIFLTDLYFRANSKVTEVNASTVAAVRGAALEQLVEMSRAEDADKALRVALTRARIFQTGLKDSGLDPSEPRQFLVPNGDLAMVVLSLPIDRVEFDERMTGHVALVAAVRSASELSDEERDELEALKLAMTKDGHPGAEVFGKMVADRAKPLDVASV